MCRPSGSKAGCFGLPCTFPSDHNYPWLQFVPSNWTFNLDWISSQLVTGDQCAILTVYIEESHCSIWPGWPDLCLIQWFYKTDKLDPRVGGSISHSNMNPQSLPHKFTLGTLHIVCAGRYRRHLWHPYIFSKYVYTLAQWQCMCYDNMIHFRALATWNM